MSPQSKKTADDTKVEFIKSFTKHYSDGLWKVGKFLNPEAYLCLLNRKDLLFRNFMGYFSRYEIKCNECNYLGNIYEDHHPMIEISSSKVDRNANQTLQLLLNLQQHHLAEDVKKIRRECQNSTCINRIESIPLLCTQTRYNYKNLMIIKMQHHYNSAKIIRNEI